jgi:hypothetical protein
MRLTLGISFGNAHNDADRPYVGFLLLRARRERPRRRTTEKRNGIAAF